MIPITCTHCGGASQIDEAWQGQWVQCPYCAMPTQAGELQAALPVKPPPPPAVQPDVATPPPPPLKAAPAGEMPAKSISEAKPQAEVERASAPAAAKPQAAAIEPAVPRAPLTREQRLALRRRVHLALAVGGGVLLAVAAYVLFLLSQ